MREAPFLFFSSATARVVATVYGTVGLGAFVVGKVVIVVLKKKEKEVKVVCQKLSLK
jgi:hypothetical protein